MINLEGIPNSFIKFIGYRDIKSSFFKIEEDILKRFKHFLLFVLLLSRV